MVKTIDPSAQRDAFFAVIRVADKLNGEFAALFREYGLTQAQFNVLRILVTGPKRGVSCQEIGDGLVQRVPDVTRLIDRMTTEKLVERASCFARKSSARERPSTAAHK